MKIRIFSLWILGALVIGGCASKKVMVYDDIDSKQINEEFEQLVQIKKIDDKRGKKDKSVEETPEPDSTPKKTTIEKKKVSPKSVKKIEKPKKEAKKPKGSSVEIPTKDVKKVKRVPDIEDDEGFDGRRPLVDPYKVGEKVVMSVTYFNMAAGDIILEVKPFVEVNNKKSYHFAVSLKSSKVFSYFYAVDDTAETFMDYESLVPSTYKIKVRHSTEIKDVRSYFDSEKWEATYWRKKVDKEGKEENKKKVWEIETHAQNVISSLYYLRNFRLKEGKELAFRVADAGKNMVFTAVVEGTEVIDTEIGKLKTVIVKPKISTGGVFKQMGDIKIWLTDDDRKLPVKIEAKIKIGTLVFKIKKLVR